MPDEVRIVGRTSSAVVLSSSMRNVITFSLKIAALGQHLGHRQAAVVEQADAAHAGIHPPAATVEAFVPKRVS